MRVTELEYVALTMMATRNNVLQSRFARGWVELLDTPENQWAHEALRGMRGAKVGAGSTAPGGHNDQVVRPAASGRSEPTPG